MEKKPSTSTKKLPRIYPRAVVGGRVLIHDDERLFIAPLSNISAGGLFIEQLVSIPAGRHVRVVVKSPKLETPVQAIGQVVRIETDSRRGLAIEFSSISKQSREIIQNCVLEARVEHALKAA